MGIDVKFLKIKSDFLKGVRKFFDDKNYLEVTTPIVVNLPGAEVNLSYFETIWEDIDGYQKKMYLRSSPEIHMKRLLNYGLDKIYQIAPSFRNHGERFLWHNPEFLMLEWYEKDLEFNSIMSQTEDLIWFLLEFLKIKFKDEILFSKTSFTKISMNEAFKNWVGIDLIDNDIELSSKAISKGIVSVKKEDDFETAFFKIIIEKIEPKLKELSCCILYDYPPSQAALSCIENGVAKRNEFYINGIEISNAFLELTGYNENKQRLKDINSLRKDKGLEVMDEKLEDPYFLSYNESTHFNKCSGNALGLDRLLSCFLSLDRIKIPFSEEFDRKDRIHF